MSNALITRLFGTANTTLKKHIEINDISLNAWSGTYGLVYIFPIRVIHSWLWLPWYLSSKESACNPREVGSIPGLGRLPGEGNGNPLLYSSLGNPMDIEAWWAILHGGLKET